MSDGQLILVAAALLAAGIAASLLASRIRLPGLLLFLAVGMAVTLLRQGAGRGEADVRRALRMFETVNVPPDSSGGVTVFSLTFSITARASRAIWPSDFLSASKTVGTTSASCAATATPMFTREYSSKCPSLYEPLARGYSRSAIAHALTTMSL